MRILWASAVRDQCPGSVWTWQPLWLGARKSLLARARACAMSSYCGCPRRTFGTAFARADLGSTVEPAHALWCFGHVEELMYFCMVWVVLRVAFVKEITVPTRTLGTSSRPTWLTVAATVRSPELSFTPQLSAGEGFLSLGQISATFITGPPAPNRYAIQGICTIQTTSHQVLMIKFSCFALAAADVKPVQQVEPRSVT
jgi:hypothetical protein